MNRYITYTAKSKILDLIKKSQSKGISIRVNSSNNVEFTLIANSDKCPENSVMLSIKPLVITCQESIQYLNVHSVDFDYKTQNFIFKRA